MEELTSRPWKKVWLSVCDFPSPVLPNMETTFTFTLALQPSRAMKSSGSETCNVRKQCASNKYHYTPYRARMSPENTHKLMRIHMEV